MICMRPIAPFGEVVRKFPALSALMTARINAAEMPKRCEASAECTAMESAGIIAGLMHDDGLLGERFAAAAADRDRNHDCSGNAMWLQELRCQVTGLRCR